MKADDLKKKMEVLELNENETDLPAGVFEYTEEKILAEEGVYPSQITDLLAIAGDPGDVIPGCYEI